jgi:acetyl esterase/lipase
MIVRSYSLAMLLPLILAGGLAAQSRQDRQDARQTKPKPDHENVKYGPHERNVLDLWLARSKQGEPTPLVLHIHGGGFRAGDKSSLSPAVLKN